MRRRVGSTSFAADVARVSAHALPRGCAARGRAVTPASGTPPAALPDPGRMFGDLVDAHEGVNPPLLRFLVDLALAHDEARVQPAVAVVLRQQFEPRDDRSAPPRLLLDALPVDGQEDVGVVRGPNDAAQVRRPHAVLSSARGIGPSDGSLQHVSRDRPIARAEPALVSSALGWIAAYCALRNTPALRPIARHSASAVGSRSIISY